MIPECTTPLNQDAGATRAAIIGNRKTPAEIANAMGCCERVIVNVINEQHVPYIKFLGRRYVEPEAIAAALLNRERNTAARKSGRPSKKAA
jgi:hypothetical protein